jgi:hypothetical protein|nr:MAG TPA: hypothetical protein [Caudoviricetes sp.]
MTKKQCIIIGIISAILTAVFLYAGYYFPHRLVKFLFCIVTVAFCFGFFYLIIAIIWTKGEILPNPYPNYYLPDPDIYLGEIKKEKK